MTSNLIEQMVASAIGNSSITNSISNYFSAQVNNLRDACPCGANHSVDQHHSVMEGMPTQTLWS